MLGTRVRQLHIALNQTACHYSNLVHIVRLIADKLMIIQHMNYEFKKKKKIENVKEMLYFTKFIAMLSTNLLSGLLQLVLSIPSDIIKS